MYVVKENNGKVIAYCSRLEDAEALCQRVGKENKKYIEKLVDNHL